MTDVKAGPQDQHADVAEPHVLTLVGRLLDLARQSLLAHSADGLRPSHLRLLNQVPADGATISELAAALVMTKQGVGQFVRQLQGAGHLQVTTHAVDRRRRVVTRTALADRRVAQADRTVAALEQQWRQRVGHERYEVFRGVLRDLAGTGGSARGSA